MEKYLKKIHVVRKIDQNIEFVDDSKLSNSSEEIENEETELQNVEKKQIRVISGYPDEWTKHVETQIDKTENKEEQVEEDTSLIQFIKALDKQQQLSFVQKLNNMTGWRSVGSGWTTHSIGKPLTKQEGRYSNYKTAYQSEFL